MTNHPRRALPLFLSLAACSGEPLAPSLPPPPSAAALSPAAAPSAAATPPPNGPVAPTAKKKPHTIALHGRTFADDYAWLREKDTPEVLEYLRAENAYAEAMTAHLAPLRERLYNEYVGRLRETDVDVPYKDKAYLYYSRTEKGKQYAIHCRKAAKGGDAAPEEVLLDLNELGKTEKFVGIGRMTFSESGNFLAYGLDTTGFRQFVLHVKDLRTGKELPDRAERVTSLAFANDDATLFYTVEDPVAKRSYRLYRHHLGKSAAEDVLVYEEKDERFRLLVRRSSSEKLIFVDIASQTTSETHFIRADKPEAPMTIVEPREQGHEYEVAHHGDELVIRTNSAKEPGGAKSTNFRLVVTKLSSPGRKSWRETIPHRPDVSLDDVLLFSKFAIVAEMDDGLLQLRVLDPKKLSLEGSHRVEIPEKIFAARPDRNAEFDTPFFRLRVESPTSPPTIYDYDPTARALTLKKRVEVPSYDPALYEAQRLHAKAADGAEVPITLVFKKGIRAGGKNPLYLEGYGSYGVPVMPSFDPEIFSMLDRGVVWALAHPRGGGERGEVWHEAGRMKHKMNTFTDFIRVTETLIESGYAAKGRVAIQGGSAGGLLMGAVMNLRPDLYRAVVADVPFVDVLNTMFSGTGVAA